MELIKRCGWVVSPWQLRRRCSIAASVRTEPLFGSKYAIDVIAWQERHRSPYNPTAYLGPGFRIEVHQGGKRPYDIEFKADSLEQAKKRAVSQVNFLINEVECGAVRLFPASICAANLRKLGWIVEDWEQIAGSPDGYSSRLIENQDGSVRVVSLTEGRRVKHYRDPEVKFCSILFLDGKEDKRSSGESQAPRSSAMIKAYYLLTGHCGLVRTCKESQKDGWRISQWREVQKTGYRQMEMSRGRVKIKAWFVDSEIGDRNGTFTFTAHRDDGSGGDGELLSRRIGTSCRSACTQLLASFVNTLNLSYAQRTDWLYGEVKPVEVSDNEPVAREKMHDELLKFSRDWCDLAASTRGYSPSLKSYLFRHRRKLLNILQGES